MSLAPNPDSLFQCKYNSYSDGWKYKIVLILLEDFFNNYSFKKWKIKKNIKIIIYEI